MVWCGVVWCNIVFCSRCVKNVFMLLSPSVGCYCPVVAAAVVGGEGSAGYEQDSGTYIVCVCSFV